MDKNENSNQRESLGDGSVFASDALRSGIQKFKSLVLIADKEMLHRGKISQETSAATIACFRALCEEMFAQLEGDGSLPKTERKAVGRWLQQELLPYLVVSNFGEIMYAKPRGYAGDYSTIQTIYDKQASGFGRTGELLDRCFLNEPAAIAVRNRRGLLLEEMKKIIDQKEGRTCAFTSLASGPAAECFDLFEQVDDPSKIIMTMVDIDYLALDFVKEKVQRLPNRKQVHIRYGNLIHMVTGKTQLDLPPQDLIYSIGLIDYFTDEFVVGLMNYIYDQLTPGGKVILGNFHPDNTTKALMDHVLDWVLIHRTEADMDRLFSASKFNRPSTKIRFESQGINLFGECIREA